MYTTSTEIEISLRVTDCLATKEISEWLNIMQNTTDYFVLGKTK